MVMHNSLSNGFFLFCGFAVWATLTIAILLIMEGLCDCSHCR